MYEFRVLNLHSVHKDDSDVSCHVVASSWEAIPRYSQMIQVVQMAQVAQMALVVPQIHPGGKVPHLVTDNHLQIQPHNDSLGKASQGTTVGALGLSPLTETLMDSQAIVPTAPAYSDHLVNLHNWHNKVIITLTHTYSYNAAYVAVIYFCSPQFVMHNFPFSHQQIYRHLNSLSSF